MELILQTCSGKRPDLRGNKTVAEYKDYRLDVRLLSPVGTPWQSDTLMGLMAWIVSLEEGDAGVKDFLEPFLQGDPPFVFSDGFPWGLLPKPFYPLITENKEYSVEENAQAKKRKGSPFVTLPDFDLIRRGREPTNEPISSPWTSFEMLHAAIDRKTWSTGGEGNLFTTISDALSEDFGGLSVYVRAKADQIGRVKGIFEVLADIGFGRDKSTGHGRFEVHKIEEITLFEQFDEANGFISMSTWVPAAADPSDGFWKLNVKRGKLGEGAGKGNPFKRPVIQFMAGSTFRTIKPPRPWYGRVVKGIAPSMPDAVQICLCLSVPCAFPPYQ